MAPERAVKITALEISIVVILINGENCKHVDDSEKLGHFEDGVGRKALFLDRDGVINEDFGHVHRIQDVKFLQGIFDLCRLAIRRDYSIIVVTNQGGIARNLYSEDAFHKLTSWMRRVFADHGVFILDVYYCPYHPEFGVGSYKRDSADRKPRPGMLLRAKVEHCIDMSRSVLIGDKETDIEAGAAAGLGNTILLSGEAAGVCSKANYVVSSLPDAATILDRLGSKQAFGSLSQADLKMHTS